MKVESEKVGLKLNIQKTKIMASGPITSWEIGGETVETVGDFIFWGSKITVDGDCSHEIKRCLLLGRKVMTNLDSILKSREESWVLKNWCFWIVVLEKTLESPLDSRRSNQSILKEISPGCLLERLMLKLKLQYFGHLMRRVHSLEGPWCWEGQGAGGEEDDKGWDVWMASPTWWTWVWVNSESWWWTGRHAEIHEVAKS